MSVVDEAAQQAEDERLVEVGRALLDLRGKYGDAALRDTLSGLDGRHLADAERGMAMAQREAQTGAKAAAEWRATPATMAHHLSGGRVQLFDYVELLGRKFVDACEGRSKRQIWNLPSQYGKSTIASQWGPTWALDHFPHWRLILNSYGDELADANALAVRDLMTTHADQLHTSVRRDARRRDRFLTPEGGGVLAAGMNSAATGFPAHGLVIDDPFKGWPDAHSVARRKFVWDQYRSVFRMRQTWDDFWIIVVMTRWHEDDLTAKLIDEMLKGGEDWEVTRLAEVAEEPDPHSTDYFARLPDPMGRAPGEILEPRRFNEQSVADRRKVAGPYLWAGMHLQRPSPEEGGEFKRGWWVVEQTLPLSFDQVISSWDMKLKEKKSGDYQSGQVWGRTGGSVWLLDHIHGQWNMATVTNAIALLHVRHPVISVHLIENTGNGPEVMDELRKARPDYVLDDEIADELGMTIDEREKVQLLRRHGMSALVPQNPKGDKITRARAFVGMLEGGDCHILDTPGGRALVDQAASFPDQGAHDDMVDSWSQAMNYLRGGSTEIETPDQSQRVEQQSAADRQAGQGQQPSASVIDPRARMLPRGARLSDIRRQ